MISLKPKNPNLYLQIAIIFLALLLAAASGVMAKEEPILLIIALVGLIIGIASLIWPDLTTVSFFLILLTNSATIAVKIHGLPFIIGAAFPLLLFVPVVYYVVIRQQKIIITPLMLPIVIFLFVQILGVFVSVKIGDAVEEVFNYVIEAVLLYPLIINSIRSMKSLKRVMWAFLISAIILGGIPTFQELTKTYDNEYWGYGQISSNGFETGTSLAAGQVLQQRLGGAIGEQNNFARVMLMLGMIAMAQALGAPPGRFKWVAFAATAAGLIATLLTFSRGAVVAFVVTSLVAVTLSVISPKQLVIVAFTGILLLFAFPQFSDRILSIGDSFSFASGSSETADTSTLGRATEMLAALIIYAEHPIIGVGPNQFRRYVLDVSNDLGIKRLTELRQAHNFYLDIAANTGTLGLGTILVFIYMTTRRLMYVRKRWIKDYPELSNIATGFILAIISYLGNGMFLHFSYQRYFWGIMAVAGSVIYISNQLEKQHKEDEKKAELALQLST